MSDAPAASQNVIAREGSPTPAPGSSDVERILAQARRRRRVGIAVMGLAVIIWSLMFFGSLFGGTLITYSLGRWSSGTLGPEIEVGGAGLDGPLVLIVPAAAYAVFFVLPLLFLLPIALFMAVRWRHPPLIVVFRPFNAAYDRRLTVLLSRTAASFGHVFTLADRNIAPPWNVRVPLLIGQMALAHFSVPMLRTPRDINRLVVTLSQRRAITVGWLLSFRKIFPIRTSDPVWEDCVYAILGKADVVLIDISSRSRSVAWEIERALDRGLANRVSLLCRHEDAEVAGQWLAKLGHPNLCALSVFTYRKQLDDPAGFSRRLAAMCVEAARAQLPTGITASAPLRRIVATTSGLVALAIVAGGPYLLPRPLTAWSPIDVQLLHAFIYRGSQEALVRLDSRDHSYTVAALKNHISASSPEVRGMGMLGLGRVGDEAVIPHILAGWTRSNDGLVAEAVGRVADRHGESAFARVISGMHDLKMPFSILLFNRLAGRGGTRPISETIAGLADDSEGVRFFSARQLGDTMLAETIPVLLEMTDWTTEVRNWFSSHREAPLAEDAAEQLQKFLKQEGELNFDITRLDHPLQRSTGRAAYFAVRLVIRQGVDRQHLADVLKQRGDRNAAPIVQAFENCDTGITLAGVDSVLAALTVQGLLAALSTETEPCVLLGAAKGLAVRGRIEALAPAVRAAGVRRWWIVGDHHLDQGANAVFSELARTLQPGTRLGLRAKDFESLSTDSYLQLIHLSATLGDTASLRSAVMAYGSFAPWSRRPIAFPLAHAIPQDWSTWVNELAQSSETPEAKLRYVDLLGEMAASAGR